MEMRSPEHPKRCVAASPNKQADKSDHMSASRRSILAAAGAGLALPQPISTSVRAQAHRGADADQAVDHLTRLSAEAHAALMDGDLKRYRELISYADDFTLMSPFGGKPTHASEFTPERMGALGRFFKNGTFEQEVIQTYGSADMVVLAIIERQNVEVGGLPAQDWALRVTLVFRRDGTEWRLAHRHADPLAKGISLEQVAVLARGEASKESGLPPIIAGPGGPAIAAAGPSLVVREWTDSGPSYLHIHRSDDEAWYVLEGSLRFRFLDREIEAPAGTTVFVPAGIPHTYVVT
jgi:ketosteroid isomerase-like protein